MSASKFGIMAVLLLCGLTNHCFSQADSTKFEELKQYSNAINKRVDSIYIALIVPTLRGRGPGSVLRNQRDSLIRVIKISHTNTLKDLASKRQAAYFELATQQVPMPPEILAQKKAAIEVNYAKGKYDADLLFNQKVDLLLTGVSYILFPARSNFTASKFYTGRAFRTFQLINNSELSASFENGAFANEIAASFFGPFRGSFNTVLSKQKVSKIDNSSISGLNQQQLQALIASTDSLNRASSTLLKIAAGGGEIGFNLKTPILNLNGDKDDQLLAFQTEFVGNVTSDLPIAGSYIEKSQLSFFYMLQLQNKLLLRPSSFDGNVKKPGDFSIYAVYNIGYIGGLEKFYQNLSIPIGKNFYMHDFLAGITYKNFSIFYTYQTFSISELQGKIAGRLGFSFINNL